MRTVKRGKAVKACVGEQRRVLRPRLRAHPREVHREGARSDGVAAERSQGPLPSPDAYGSCTDGRYGQDGASRDAGVEGNHRAEGRLEVVARSRESDEGAEGGRRKTKQRNRAGGDEPDEPDGYAEAGLGSGRLRGQRSGL